MNRLLLLVFFLVFFKGKCLSSNCSVIDTNSEFIYVTFNVTQVLSEDVFVVYELKHGLDTLKLKYRFDDMQFAAIPGFTGTAKIDKDDLKSRKLQFAFHYRLKGIVYSEKDLKCTSKEGYREYKLDGLNTIIPCVNWNKCHEMNEYQHPVANILPVIDLEDATILGHWSGKSADGDVNLGTIKLPFDLWISKSDNKNWPYFVKAKFKRAYYPMWQMVGGPSVEEAWCIYLGRIDSKTGQLVLCQFRGYKDPVIYERVYISFVSEEKMIGMVLNSKGEYVNVRMDLKKKSNLSIEEIKAFSSITPKFSLINIEQSKPLEAGSSCFVYCNLKNIGPYALHGVLAEIHTSPGSKCGVRSLEGYSNPIYRDLSTKSTAEFYSLSTNVINPKENGQAQFQLFGDSDIEVETMPVNLKVIYGDIVLYDTIFQLSLAPLNYTKPLAYEDAPLRMKGVYNFFLDSHFNPRNGLDILEKEASKGDVKALTWCAIFASTNLIEIQDAYSLIDKAIVQSNYGWLFDSEARSGDLESMVLLSFVRGFLNDEEIVTVKWDDKSSLRAAAKVGFIPACYFLSLESPELEWEHRKFFEQDATIVLNRVNFLNRLSNGNKVALKELEYGLALNFENGDFHANFIRAVAALRNGQIQIAEDELQKLIDHKAYESAYIINQNIRVHKNATTEQRSKALSNATFFEDMNVSDAKVDRALEWILSDNTEVSKQGLSDLVYACELRNFRAIELLVKYLRSNLEWPGNSTLERYWRSVYNQYMEENIAGTDNFRAHHFVSLLDNLSIVTQSSRVERTLNGLVIDSNDQTSVDPVLSVLSTFWETFANAQNITAVEGGVIESFRDGITEFGIVTSGQPVECYIEIPANSKVRTIASGSVSLQFGLPPIAYTGIAGNEDRRIDQRFKTGELLYKVDGVWSNRIVSSPNANQIISEVRLNDMSPTKNIGAITARILILD